MKLWSISFSYKLGLAFHAMNNEGSDGSNLMQPRQIDVGASMYDGISGAIIRHHILENLVRICDREGLPSLPLSAGLHPDRGPIGIRAVAKQTLVDGAKLDNSNVYRAARESIARCTIIDIGGYLAAWKESADTTYLAEGEYIRQCCASLDPAKGRAPEPLKRESCFDVGWLISDAPQERAVTEHSAFRDTFGKNSRYAQTMRSNTYGGVIRAELHRVGIDDHWYLQASVKEKDRNRLTIPVSEQLRRQTALIEAITNFIAAPSAAKMAAWAPHVFLTEGAILLSSARTAPFVSPIAVDLSDEGAPVKPNPTFSSQMMEIANGKDTMCWQFQDVKSLLAASSEASIKLKEQ